jgi:hypothetical protein
VGKQVGFYMSLEDEAEFVRFVKSTGDVSVLPARSPSPQFQDVEVLPEPLKSDHWYVFYLFNRDVSSRLVIQPIPQHGQYDVNSSVSSVIEFLRTRPEGNRMHPGRIWADFRYFDENRMTFVMKEPAFAKWYERIARWIRRNFEYLEPHGYVGPTARKRISNGMVLDPV